MLCIAAAAPFAPALWQFFQAGVTDPVLSGDAATLELGVRHATTFTQLLGPYSRFGWNHPGPLYFYLAAPIYELLSEHSSALNVFALAVNGASAVATVLIAKRLRGELFAIAVAALLAVFELVALPFLIANEWNPILPILPLVCLSVLAVRLATTNEQWSPMFVFLASAIVQTHVGYAPAVAALAGLVLFGPPLAGATPLHSRWSVAMTITVLVLCWFLPLYEAATAPSGNLQRLGHFVVPKGMFEHSIGDALRHVAEQCSAMLVAVAETLSRRHVTLEFGGQRFVLAAQVLALIVLGRKGRRSGDAVLRAFAAAPLVLFAAAFVAVFTIKGEILPYLVSWCAVTGLMTGCALAARLVQQVQDRGAVGSRAMLSGVSIAVIGLAMTGPVRRSAIAHESDIQTETLARDVADYLRSADLEGAPALHIEAHDEWPTAVGIVLYLHKAGIPIYVAREWQGMVGSALTHLQHRTTDC